MAQEIFERYEKKYLLTEVQYLGLKRVFEDRMAADAATMTPELAPMD